MAAGVRGVVSREPVRYRLGWSDANTHLFEIELSFIARGRETRLELPAWRPGRYLIQNYAANVRDWSAEVDGQVAQIEKIEKSAWIVRSRRGANVTVRYRFYAGVLDAGSSFLDEVEAYFNGSNLFMMVTDQRGAPCELALKIPRGWSVATQLARVRSNVFRARHYDYLIDSPTVISPRLERRSFRVAKSEVSLVFVDPPSGFDLDVLTRATERIVMRQVELFGELPSNRYDFLYHFGVLWHGVEHEDSCSIVVNEVDLQGATPGDLAYDHLLSITSHEFFHLWNVKRILPARFAPYDYSRETPTTLLWVMEGITSYYGERTLLESGLWDGDRYLQHLASEITTLERSPGKSVTSLAQAGFDSWLTEPAQMHDRANVWFSFYNKGEVVAALLDLLIRRTTRGRRTLDDVMRQLWRVYGKRGRGLEEGAFDEVAARIGGEEVAEFLQLAVHSVSPLRYDDVLSSAGLRLRRIEDTAAPRAGCTLRVDNGRLIVQSVRAESAAARAGLLPGDEVLSVNGRRIVTQEGWNRHVGRGGSSSELLTSRRGRIAPRSLEGEPDTPLKFVLERDETANATRAEWLKEA